MILGLYWGYIGVLEFRVYMSVSGAAISALQLIHGCTDRCRRFQQLVSSSLQNYHTRHG